MKQSLWLAVTFDLQSEVLWEAAQQQRLFLRLGAEVHLAAVLVPADDAPWGSNVLLQHPFLHCSMTKKCQGDDDASGHRASLI